MYRDTSIILTVLKQQPRKRNKMKLITNNTDPMDSTGTVIRADLSADGKSTTYSVYHNGVLLDAIKDDSVLTVAAKDDKDNATKVAIIKANAYSKVAI